MSYEDLRISKLRMYLFSVINNIIDNDTYQINADMLGEIDDYSLNKMPTNTNIEQWITGTKKKRDVYSFRSRKSYSQDTIDNLLNIGFFERFENIINSNNDRGILPDIENVESIECLNSGTMLSSDNGNSAIFDIQIQITYINKEINGGVSL